MKKLTEIFVSIFYIGFIKFAPGTWGTLASLLIMFFLFETLSINFSTLMILFIVLLFISIFFVTYFSSMTKTHDSKLIIIDEFLGIFTIFLFYDFIFIHNIFVTYFLIFFLFRFFDITKIFPANYFDTNLKNAYGIILDDIIAGLYTVLTLILINVFI